jgi:hypothetical protein
MPDMPREVQEAYEQAARKQPAQSEPLPSWETLSLELREAFIYVYYQGRLEGVREMRELPGWSRWATRGPAKARAEGASRTL